MTGEVEITTALPSVATPMSAVRRTDHRAGREGGRGPSNEATSFNEAALEYVMIPQSRAPSTVRPWRTTADWNHCRILKAGPIRIATLSPKQAAGEVDFERPRYYCNMRFDRALSGSFSRRLGDDRQGVDPTPELPGKETVDQTVTLEPALADEGLAHHL